MESVRCTRLGANVPGNICRNPRPLLVSLSSRAEVLHVLKNRPKVKFEGKLVQVKSDQTAMQRKQWADARAALNEKKKNGDTDWVIKYNNGVPQVVKKSEVPQTKN